MTLPRKLLTAAAIAAAVVTIWVAAWPPSPAPTTGRLDPELQRRTLAGAFHVHSTQSDGASTRAVIAAAAARAGLQFVVFTDHGDATRPPEPPIYSSGVLCVDAVEISSSAGHYVAIGMEQAPYRIGGDAAGVVEDVRRFGGFGIVAHPDSPKPGLAWHDWSVEPDGVEWLNADSAWRGRSVPSLVWSLLGYAARPGPALAAMLDRPAVTLTRWDTMSARRQVPVFAAHDAHGGVAAAADDRSRPWLPGVPSYSSSFESFTMRAVLSAPPVGSATIDAQRLIEALRQGRTYSVIDGVAAGGWLDFTAERNGATAEAGERLGGEGQVTLTVRAATVPGSTVVLIHDGKVLSETAGGEVVSTVRAAGAYRVEVRLPGSANRAPWMLSNAISIDVPSQAPPSSPSFVEVASLTAAPWRIERDPSSLAELTADHDRPAMTFRLQPGTASPFAALVAPLPAPLPAFDAMLLDLVSPTPARLSVQLRSADGSGRWRTSSFVSSESRPIVIRTSDLLPAEPNGPPFKVGAAASLLLVFDLVNSVPGRPGQVTVRQLALGSSR